LGTYLCESASSAAIVFRHEGDDDHEITISAGISGALGHGPFAPVPQVWLDRAQAGKRYFVSLALTEAEPAPAPVAAHLPAWAVKPDAARTAPADNAPATADTNE
jgi:hypothetical protein